MWVYEYCVTFFRSTTKFLKREGITEDLKEHNQWEWVCHMQNIEVRVREIVLYEMIYR
ncbi:MAG: TnpV protein [Ruminococcus sp.]|nr:TnpV protein [Ruminococcus sp.]